MKKLFLDFYGEKISIPFPKDFSSLSKEINQIIQLNLPEVFSLNISYTKNKIKKSIQTENDYKIFICSKAPIINLEIVDSKESFEKNSFDFELKTKEEKKKHEIFVKKKEEIKRKLEIEEKEFQNIVDESKKKIESLNQLKAQYIKKIQNEMKPQNKKEKELVSKITQLSKEIKVPLLFKFPEKGPLPIKGNTQKEKEYLQLVKQYTDCIKLGEKIFSIPRKSIDEIDKQIK